MAKDVLLIESDSDLAQRAQNALEAKGFAVQVTEDGKAAVDGARKNRPDLIVLAAELSQGQSGYLICREFKKDDGLKTIPLIITGDPEKFPGHKKLKTRAEEYVAKPMDVDTLVDTVGQLIGFPEAALDFQSQDDSLNLSELVDEPAESLHLDREPEEIAVEPESNEIHEQDSDLSALDSAFDGMTASAQEGELDASERTNIGFEAMPEDDAVVVEETFGEAPADPEPPPPPVRLVPEDESDEDAPTRIFELPTQTPPAQQRRPITSRFRTQGNDNSELAAELKGLHARIAELKGELDDAQTRAQTQLERAQDLEAELSAKTSELETAKASSGKSDKEFFSLRESINKKDKELLRLKNELNERDRELVELKDRETQLEQQLAESQGRDTQVKTLTAKVDQLTSEKRKLESLLPQLREEARTAAGKVSALEIDLEQTRASLAELEQMRAQAEGIDIQLQETQADLQQARGDIDQFRDNLEKANQALEAANKQSATQATAFADEMGAARRKLAELEESSAKNEERVGKLFARIRSDEKLREKTKKALSIALQLLEEQQAVVESNPDEDEALA